VYIYLYLTVLYCIIFVVQVISSFALSKIIPGSPLRCYVALARATDAFDYRSSGVVDVNVVNKSLAKPTSVSPRVLPPLFAVAMCDFSSKAGDTGTSAADEADSVVENKDMVAPVNDARLRTAGEVNNVDNSKAIGVANHDFAVVQVGSGIYGDFDHVDVVLLRRMTLLKALKKDEGFEHKLKEVNLDDCEVLVGVTARDEPDEADMKIAQPLKGAATVESCVNDALEARAKEVANGGIQKGDRSPMVFIRVVLPESSKEQGMYA
jgi:hypothetical protein